MGLASPSFVFLFLAPCVGLHLLVSRVRPEWSAGVLLLASVAYCIIVEPLALPIVMTSAMGNYWLTGKILESKDEPRVMGRWVAVGVLANVVPLLWFKFRLVGLPGDGGFGSASSAAVLTAGIPLGLAFYSLQQVTGLFDIQRPDAVRLSPWRHALMTGMFAQLSAGPIGRYRELAPQYQSLGQRPVPMDSVLRGAALVVFGLAKKALLADPLASVVNQIYSGAATQSVTPVDAWYATWGFLLQLYLDFSAYSDIAIGAALCVGIRLPINFNSPLRAPNVSEYVNRWHISLISFTRDYVFAPVFARLRRIRMRSAQRRNLFAWSVATLIAYAVIGAWHAPTVTILAYSVLVGSIVVLVQMPAFAAGMGRRTPSPWGQRIRAFTGRVGLLLLAALAGVLFRADTMDTLGHLLSGLVDFRSLSLSTRLPWVPAFLEGQVNREGLMPLAQSPTLWNLFVLSTATVATLGFSNSMVTFGLVEESDRPPFTLPRWRPGVGWGVVIGLLLAAWLMASFTVRVGPAFVYERF